MTQLAVVHCHAPEVGRACLSAMLASLQDLPGTTTQTVEHDTVVAGVLGPGGASTAVLEQGQGVLLVGDARLSHRDALCQALGCAATVEDGALLLAAYQRWGPSCIYHIYGEHSLVVVDRRRGSIFCLRDALGLRPLYYAAVQPADDPPLLLVSSDLQAVRAGLLALGYPPQLDEAYVLSYVADGLTWDPRATFTSGIDKVPPGHILSWYGGELYLDRWWHPETLPPRRVTTLHEASQELRNLIETSLRDTTRGTQGVGVHISGGLDSSLMAALTCQVRSQEGLPRPRAYTWTPPPGPGEPAAENELVRATAEHLGLHLHHHQLDEADLLRYLALDPAALPIEDTLSHELFIQEQAQRDGVQLLISGFGGDEVVSGHGQTYYSELLLDGRWGKLLRELYAQRSLTPRQLLHRLLAPTWYALRPLRLPTNGAQALASHHRDRPRPYRRTFHLPARQRDGMLWRLTGGSLGARLESYAAFGARRGIRYAFPLLDRKVVEYSLCLAPEHFSDGRQGRRLARAVAGSLLPKSVVEQPKKEDTVRLRLVYKTLLAVVERLAREGSLAACDPTRLAFIDPGWLAAGLTPPAPRRIIRFLEVLQLIGLAGTIAAAPAPDA